MPNPNDPRVKRTRKMLQESLIALILERGYDDLTITDITERAELRRATFYLHYKDKEELLLALLSETFDRLVSELNSESNDIITREGEKAVLLTLFRHVEANADLYRSILKVQGSMGIIQYVRRYMAAQAREKLAAVTLTDDLPTSPDLLANSMAGMQFSNIMMWLDEGLSYTAEEMAEMCLWDNLFAAREQLRRKLNEAG